MDEQSLISLMRIKLLMTFILAIAIPAIAQKQAKQGTFKIVEEAAAFPGGMGKFYKYVRDNI